MITESQNTQSIKHESWKLFDEISPRYDLLNRLLSFGQDLKWRKSLGRYLPAGSNLKILDVATGTADVLLEIVDGNSAIKSACGIDMSQNMLNLGQIKIKERKLDSRIELLVGDANHIPFPDGSFDMVTIAFGIRNMAEPKKVLKEIYRVLKPGGRGLILEFSLSKSSFVRFFQIAYLRHLVPMIGYAFSGHFRAYQYLNQTIENFPYGGEFLKILKECNFTNLTYKQVMFGAATIYQADRV